MTTSTETRKPLTAITWDAVGYLSATSRSQHRIGWAEESDLEHELAPLLPHLDMNSVKALVTAAGKGLPVLITWDLPFTKGRVARHTANCLIEWMSVPRDLPGGRHDVNHLGYVQAARLGFGGPIYLANIRKAEFFHAETVYLDADQA